MNRELLEKPFAPAQIRQRKGRNGLLDYVEGHSVIQRLNEALEGAWSFEIVQHEIREEEVLVLAKLTAEGITKMNFGVSQVTRERESGALVSLGDDLKAAGTAGLPLAVSWRRPGPRRRRGRRPGCRSTGPGPSPPASPATAGRATARPPGASRPGSSTRSGRWGRPRGSTRTRWST